MEIDAEANEQFEAEMKCYAEIGEARNKWKAKWPNHCQACGGWGMLYTPGQYSGPPERCYPETYDPCESLPDGSCHRCGKPDAVESHEELSEFYPCRFCGWNFDDGAPS